MKSVLLSIKPKYAELIANGEKTIEVRKSAPKEVPFKAYIYETKGATEMPWVDEDGHFIYKGRGQVIGEFVCDNIYNIKPHCDIGDYINQYECGWKYGEDFHCLSFSEMKSYLKNKKGYGWHISNLKIYDKPKDLIDFRKPCPYTDGSYCLGNKCDYYDDYSGKCCCVVERPFQSWGYVDKL